VLFFQILFIVSLLLGIVFLIFSRNPKKQEFSDEYMNKSIDHIKELFPVSNIYGGIIYSENKYYLLAKIEGVNFSVMSTQEQDARESALIEIFAKINYPIKFITNTVIVDTTEEARRIAKLAAQSEESNLKTYQTMYAGALELMRSERSVLSQKSYLIIPGVSEKEALERFSIIQSSLKNTSVILTLIDSTDEVFDSIQSILLPEKIIKPSDMAQQGVLSGLHFNEKELTYYTQKI